MLSHVKVFKPKRFFYPTLKKHNFFSYKHKIYILQNFKSHIKKITFFLMNIDYTKRLQILY
jgi:hypothetical protein